MRVRHIMVAAAIFVAATSASGQSVAGKWTVSYPVGMIQNGVRTETIGTAALSLELKGDSVFGTWQSLNTPVAVPAREFKGTFKDGKLLFETVSEATIRQGGMGGDGESKIRMRTYYEATLKGDNLDGTMSAKSEDGSIDVPSRAWTAKRGEPAKS
ncbi:MAG TPA: hypothetical protein VM100_01550 [Longimicrobiales bacterium]|nr:hypothetical protein [Longimicrobiales bacterium]